MDRHCHLCHQGFTITGADQQLLTKLAPTVGNKTFLLPLPNLCSACRLQRRLSYRNEKNFYARKCSATGESIIAIYHDDSPFPVYNAKTWWSDSWDPKSFGREFDFNKSFFEQWTELRNQVPRIALLSKNSENSAYTNHATNNKNCYLSTIVFSSEEVYFSRKVLNSRQVFDSDFILQKCEILYECFWGELLYNSKYCVYCTNSNNLLFCYDCKSCKDCYMSSNLRNKQYVFCNVQLSQDEYEQRLVNIDTGSFEKVDGYKQAFQSLVQKAIKPALKIEKCENVSGDYLLECKDCVECYYGYKGQNCHYCLQFDSADERFSKDCMDCYGFGGSELLYEVHAQANGYNNKFCNLSYDISNCMYVDMCFNIKNCFGCIGLHAKEEYCILNKQYTKEQYNELVPRIIEYMKSTSEFGEFFPSSCAPFSYQETMANDIFPLTKEQASAKGFVWHDYVSPASTVKTITVSELLDNISEVNDSILDSAIECAVSKKPFRLLKQELEFYRANKITIPRKHPQVRYTERMKMLNLPKLYRTQCVSCQTDIETSYPPEHQHNLHCQSCYEKVLY